jgi:hypothetical protein
MERRERRSSGTQKGVVGHQGFAGRIGGLAKIFFITFVDAIFTILFERLFTNVFVVTAQPVANPCLYPACNAD